MQAKKNNKLIHYLWAGRCSATSRTAVLITCNDYLARQMLSVQISFFFFFLSSFVAEDDIVLRVTSVWSAGVTGPGCDPSQLLVNSSCSLVAEHVEQRRSWWQTCKQCSTATATLLCYQYYFHHKSKTQHPTGFYE